MTELDIYHVSHADHATPVPISPTSEHFSEPKTIKESAERLQEATVPQTATQHPVLKIAWIIVYLGVTAMFLYQFSELVENYAKYPTNIQINIETARSLKFPAVTVCNENPIRKSQVERVRSLRGLMNSFLTLTDPEGCGRNMTMCSRKNYIPKKLISDLLELVSGCAKLFDSARSCFESVGL